MNLTSPLDYALSYIARGWPVSLIWEPVRVDEAWVCSCPQTYKDREKCSPGKHPRNDKGVKGASIDPDVVTRWWTSMAPNATIGVDLAGARILDIAPDNPVFHADFIARGLPPTFSFTSGGGDGHQHWLYALPEGVPQARICRSGEYDILSAGYAIMPPSRHGLTGGLYRVVDDLSLAEAPAWACGLLIDATRRPKGRIEVDGAIISGEDLNRLVEQMAADVWNGTRYSDRSTSLVAIAGDLPKLGATQPTIVAVLHERDITLGFLKFAARRNPEEQYQRIAARAMAENPPNIPRGLVGGGVKTEPDDTEGHGGLLGSIPDPPIEALPEECRALIRESSLPPALLVGALGAALDAAIGGVATAVIETSGGGRIALEQRSITWTALIGPPGISKSPALELAYATILEVEEERRVQFREDWRTYKADRDAAQDKKTFDENEPPPVLRTRTVEDITAEALIDLLVESPARALWADELSLVLAGLGEYKRTPTTDNAPMLGC